MVGLVLVTLSGCSAASTMGALNIDGLKGVEFGESEGRVRDKLKTYELTPTQSSDPTHYATFACDGLTLTYDAVQFVPNFLFKKGRLVAIKGFIVNADAQTLVQLQKYLDDKFGQPQIKDGSKQWSDGGVKVSLSSLGRNEGHDYNFIGFVTPDQ